MKNFKQNILNKIKSGEIDMKPRWYFVFKGLLLVLGLISMSLVVVYLISFILFALRQSGVGFAPAYGFRGLSMFVIGSPWLLILSSGFFLLLLYVLVSRYSFSYRRPLLYSMIGVVSLVLLSSLVIGQTGAHRDFKGYAERNNLPMFAHMYQNIESDRPDNLTVGTIEEVRNDGFIIKTDKGETLQVIIDGDTRYRPGYTFANNEKVFVFGDKVDDKITAFGIRPVPEDFDLESSEQYRGRGMMDGHRGRRDENDPSRSSGFNQRSN